MRIDLSELEPKRAGTEAGASLVGWATLDSEKPADLPRGKVRMLGYRMDGYPGCARRHAREDVHADAGQLLHAAHRIPDEMVEVWLEAGRTVPYRDRSMVWTQGILRHRQPDAAEGIAAYAMDHASVESATDRDLGQLFVPRRAD